MQPGVRELRGACDVVAAVNLFPCHYEISLCLFLIPWELCQSRAAWLQQPKLSQSRRERTT